MAGFLFRYTMEVMDAIIFAAGKGKRLRPHTETNPKPLLEVTSTKKIIDFVLEALPEEINRVIVVVDHLKELLQSYLHEKNLKKELIFVTQGDIKGTFGALLSAKPYIKSERFLILSGDDIVDQDSLQRIIKENRALGISRKIMPAYYAVERDEQQNFIGFRKNQTEDEKRDGVDIATGTYLLDSAIFDFKPVEINDGEFGLPQMFLENIDLYPLKVVDMKTWYPVNTFSDLENLRKHYENI